MNIFDKIKNAIFGTDARADEAHPSSGASGTASTAPTTPSSTAPSPVPSASPDVRQSPTTGSSLSPASGSMSASPAVAPNHGARSAGDVDVAALLDDAVAKRGQKLDWRHSIVDLMKALNLDSSLANREKLAQELNYSGDKSDSAALNTWLHKKVMEKLNENGGRVPTELK